MNFMKTIINSIKFWVNGQLNDLKSKFYEDLETKIDKDSEMTNDDALNLLSELSVVEPVTNENGAIYTDENGAIYTDLNGEILSL